MDETAPDRADPTINPLDRNAPAFALSRAKG